MPLATINDLLTSAPDEVEGLIKKASALCDVYETHLAEDAGDAHLRVPGIHASEVSGCGRRIVYSLIGMERRELLTAPVWRRRFRIGHAVHEMFQRDFKRMARAMGISGVQDWHISFEEEVPIAPRFQAMAHEWSIYSHCDGVFTIRERWDGPVVLRVLLEIKTKSPAQYELLMKKAHPELDHVEQAHVYMACLDVPMTWFLYYNKGNQNYTGTDIPGFLIRFDPLLWATLEERFRRAHDAAAAAVPLAGQLLESNLPPREESVKCDFCAFSWTCKPARLNGARKPAWQALRGPDD
jgi:hypothetical protein